MEQIDWSKAPEGATHWCDESDTDYACWLRRNEDGSWDGMFLSDGAWSAASVDADTMRTTTPRPAAWTGEGLPPVGVECEACWTSPDEYCQIKVLAHDDDKAVYRWLTGPGAGELSESDGRILAELTDPHPTFRPIRTPEQIAAEEREKAVDEMMAAHEPWIDTRRFCKKLYDAGYRKP